MIMTIQEFVNKYNWKRIDFDNFAGYQCVDLTRQRLKESGLPQYRPLGNNWCKLIALNPNAYLVAPLRWVQNDLKKPNQIPKPWDIIIFSVPKSTWHIAVVTGALPWVNSLTIFEQNGWKWTTTGVWVDACRIRKITYRNVLGWITW